jgi:hypothetical protein
LTSDRRDDSAAADSLHHRADRDRISVPGDGRHRA